MTNRTALVTGASGLAGSYMLAHLLKQGGWDVVAVSRRKPQVSGDYRYIAADLLDPYDCQAKLGSLNNITHAFYLAITERADPNELGVGEHRYVREPRQNCRRCFAHA